LEERGYGKQKEEIHTSSTRPCLINPARGLGKKIDEYEDDQGWEQLDADGCAPLRLTLYKEEAITNELAASNAECL
jgi:hypothetical protein